ncbi:MAG: hypothetical protein COS85_00760 [Armatimonadetes bacterium CG07_land_8_20_14_0_80_59_28]|nr:MAG: hypothetical protein COS85_00760 [Armatimonadetes bacterium CG07_land_8_20_14_0_80_59_28]PIX41390.1 MAG: hypothetical protein COZ56_12230 [Armatimonadetes bacterium CG_4_8_14_3_um_filter_58_9]PIY48858.1 MAG: hypothetical protein COZ05_01940 [Armatimonadetes bacterium CG_4_10_14_3_um_filter_59_10]
MKQLDHIKLHFTNQGQLEQLDDLDRFARKMSTLVDSIRYADYGITGFFDAIKIDEGDLDRLYEHDSSVAASLRELGQAIAGLQTATGENLPTLLDDIETRAEEIRDRWARREQIVTGLSEEGAP